MNDFLTNEQLAECPVCGAVGLPERIDTHDCEAFREWKEVGR